MFDLSVSEQNTNTIQWRKGHIQGKTLHTGEISRKNVRGMVRGKDIGKKEV